MNIETGSSRPVAEGICWRLGRSRWAQRAAGATMCMVVLGYLVGCGGSSYSPPPPPPPNPSPSLANGSLSPSSAVVGSAAFTLTVTGANFVFAANNEASGDDFYALSVDSSGVALVKNYPNTFSNGVTRIHFDAGTKRMYADGGLVLDPGTGLPAGNFNIQHIMVPDSSLNTGFIIPYYTTGSNTLTIESFDLTHFTPLGSITIPNVTADAIRLIRWGQNGLAFITGSFTVTGQVYLVGGSFVSPAPPFTLTPPPAVAPPPTPAANAPTIASLGPSSAIARGSGFTLTVTGSSFDTSATVQLNGNALATTFVSSTQLHANVLAANIATAGTLSITVANPAASGGVSAASTFFVGTAGGTSSSG